MMNESQGYYCFTHNQAFETSDEMTQHVQGTMGTHSVLSVIHACQES